MCTYCIDIEYVTGLHASIKQCVAGTVSIRCASGQCLAVLAINVCINKLSYAAAGKKACAQLLHKLMGDAASAISFQSQRLVPVSDHSPTSIPILVPIINPDDSSAEYTLTMKEAATLAYLWNVGLFPSESAKPKAERLTCQYMVLYSAALSFQMRILFQRACHIAV